MLAAHSKVVPAPITEVKPREEACSWKSLISPVEPFLEAVNRRLAKQVEAFDPSIAPYADYALNGQGKHLRPALVAMAADAMGGATDAHVTVAVIIEMVHLATLVHDDVMDEAEIRRNKLTLAASCGNEIAVLFGDCLFAQALKLAAGFPTPEICRSVAVATKTVCSGEILQTQQRRDFTLSRAEYFKVIEMKTAELFALSCELSACLSGATSEQRAALRQFGLAFGTGYQVYDDCVDLFGSEAVAGKSLGTDLTKGKLTLPVLVMWERADAADRARLRHLVENWQAGCMQEVAQLLGRYDALSASIETIHGYLEKARRCLAPFLQSRDTLGLTGLTAYLARQTAALEVCV
jgi:octaprenyl-diphosphate synthase